MGKRPILKRIIQVRIFRGDEPYVAECLDLPVVGIAPNPTILASLELDAVA